MPLSRRCGSTPPVTTAEGAGATCHRPPRGYLVVLQRAPVVFAPTGVEPVTLAELRRVADSIEARAGVSWPCRHPGPLH